LSEKIKKPVRNGGMKCKKVGSGRGDEKISKSRLIKIKEEG
jgi:hypothetical protein